MKDSGICTSIRPAQILQAHKLAQTLTLPRISRNPVDMSAGQALRSLVGIHTWWILCRQGVAPFVATGAVDGQESTYETPLRATGGSVSPRQKG
jgi:hypothetical protein